MMKLKHIIYLFLALAMTACTADDDVLLNDEQQSLMGRAVNFSATMADPFVTRTTYHHDGSFNEGDQMRIFRQYAEKGSSTTFEDTTIFRTYYLKMDYAACRSTTTGYLWPAS